MDFPPNMEWWEWITEDAVRNAGELEAKKEIHPWHRLYWISIRAIARNYDDDVLFEIENGEYAIIHLTWSQKPERGIWPSTDLFESFEDLKNWRP